MNQTAQLEIMNTIRTCVGGDNMPTVVIIEHHPNDSMPPTIIIGETDDSDRGKREQTESQRRRSKGE